MTISVDRGTDTLRIRQAKRVDLLDVYRLERMCFPSPWPYQAFAAHLDATAFLIATEDGDLAGYIVADVTDGPMFSKAHVKDLAVAPTYRQQGVGSRLLEAGLRRLAMAGANRVSLEVRTDNEPARTLYLKFGFSQDRISPGYYSDGGDASIMSRPLP